MKIFLYISVLFWSSLSFAELKINSITGYSRIVDFNQTIDKPPVRIFGGSANGNATNGCASGQTNSTSPCNSCGPAETVCNLSQIYSTLRLSFQIQSTSMTTGTPRITAQAPSVGTEPPIGQPDVAVTGVNQPRNVSVTWGEICNAINSSDSSCLNPDGGQLVLKVGIDALNDGFGPGDDFWSITVIFRSGSALAGNALTGSDCKGLCRYSLFPGDEKAFIQNVEFGAVPNAILSRAYLFCEAGNDSDATGFDNIVPVWNPLPKFLTVTNNNIVEETIEGFGNDQTYYCRSAVEDEAGNIGLYSATGFGNPAGGDNGLDPSTTTDSSCPADGLCHFVKPSAVIGLFADKQQCFIATAAFGSPLNSHVASLREFRKKFLLTHKPGQAFVRWYYKTGPAWAQWIQQSPYRMLGARILLTPVIVIAYALLYWPWTLSLGFFAVLLYLRRQRKVLA